MEQNNEKSEDRELRKHFREIFILILRHKTNKLIVSVCLSVPTIPPHEQATVRDNRIRSYQGTWPTQDAVRCTMVRQNIEQ